MSKKLIWVLTVFITAYSCMVGQINKIVKYSDCWKRSSCECDKDLYRASKAVVYTDCQGSECTNHLPEKEYSPIVDAMHFTENYGMRMRRSIQNIEKRDLIMLIVVNYTDTTDLDRLISMLSLFPLEMIKQVVEHGVLIHILKDCPAGYDIKPTDLGFGKDLNNNGIIEVERWVDLDGDRKEEPEEREDLTPEGNSWNHKNGGYNTLSNILFYKEGVVIFKGDYCDASILHEFSHAVDDALRNSKMASGWSEEIDHNYQAALDGEPDHGFVDGFAAKNKAEYLAQSIAAYLIDKDIPEDPFNDDDLLFAPDNITRTHLKEKDKAMYLFLKEKFSHPDF